MTTKEILAKLNCASSNEAIIKLEDLISNLEKEIKEVQFNPIYENVKTMKLNFLGERKDQANKLRETLINENFPFYE